MEFGDTLKDLLIKTGKTCYKLDKWTGLSMTISCDLKMEKPDFAIRV